MLKKSKIIPLNAGKARMKCIVRVSVGIVYNTIYRFNIQEGFSLICLVFTSMIHAASTNPFFLPKQARVSPQIMFDGITSSEEFSGKKKKKQNLTKQHNPITSWFAVGISLSSHIFSGYYLSVQAGAGQSGLLG